MAKIKKEVNIRILQLGSQFRYYDYITIDFA